MLLDLWRASMVASTSMLSSRSFFWSCDSSTVSATLRVRMRPVKRPCDRPLSPNSSSPRRLRWAMVMSRMSMLPAFERS